jgi:hypothetical protein
LGRGQVAGIGFVCCFHATVYIFSIDSLCHESFLTSQTPSEGGNILEQGTHEQLMRKKGFYYYLTTQQLKGFAAQ